MYIQTTRAGGSGKYKYCVDIRVSNDAVKKNTELLRKMGYGLRLRRDPRFVRFVVMVKR